MKKARLVLEDGTELFGQAFGAEGTRKGEVVFHTAMSGYQEMLTDPSYAAQILVLTAPQIGAVGTNPDDDEAARVFPSALIVRDHVIGSNFRNQEELDAYLRRHDVTGIGGFDTRSLVLHIRSRGVMRGIVTTDLDASVHALVELARTETAMEGRDLASEVATKKQYRFEPRRTEVLPGDPAPPFHDGAVRVVAYDFGLKRSMLEFLAREGADITVVPPHTTAAEVRALGAQAIFLTNGPGDPAAVAPAIEAVRELLGKLPIFGICLGHQILALAAGGTTSKMKFGHRGANQPVQDLGTEGLLVTAQNHGFCVDEKLPAGVIVTHRNLNDGSIEGIALPDARAKSVQFHPEASPGPEDARRLFREFLDLAR